MKFSEAVALVEEKANSEKIRARVDEVKILLKNEIALIKNGDERKITPNGTKKLKVLTDDLQGIVQEVRNKVGFGNISKNILPLVQKLENEWRNEVYPLIKEYDKEVDIYNSNPQHKIKLEKIEERTGTKVYSSILTDI